MTEVQKHFLGWDKPFLPEAAKWLQAHSLECEEGELGSTKDSLILVSGQAFARRLQTYFVNEANKAGRAVALPAIVTTSQFFKECIPPSVRVVEKSSVILAIVAFLRAQPPQFLRSLIGDRPIKNDNFVAWLQVARKVLETIKVGSNGGFSMEHTLWPEAAQDRLTPGAIERFSLLHQIQQHVSVSLEGETFEVLQCRLAHSDFASVEIKNIFVVGASDLSLGAILLLEQLLSQDVTVEALIRAPKCEEDGFDAYGRLIASYWLGKNIEIEDDDIAVAGSSSSQAAEAIRALSLLEGKASVDEITIAATDEKLIPILQRHIRGHKVNSRYAGGMQIMQSPVVLLLTEISEFISSQSYAAYAALVRHHDISKIASVNEETIKQLSAYSTNVVPARISSHTWFFPTDSRCCFDQLEALHVEMFDFFRQYIDLDRNPSSIISCSKAIRELLLHFYGDDELARTSTRLKVLQKIFRVLDTFDAISEGVCKAIGNVRLSEIIRFMLQELQSETIPELPDPLAIETVGWLEGMMVDTPHLIVVGMSLDLGGSNNPSDAYFPDHIRDSLGLETIERRMARDAHAVIAMQQSRAENGQVTWIVGRKNLEGDPLTPSPLLMRCASTTDLAKRAGRLVVSVDNEEPQVPPQYSNLKLGNGISIPKPSDFKFEPLQKLRVTGFKDFLACSYRFWLKHVMKLQVVEDCQTELDAKLFGTFMHSVLQRFGEDVAMNHISDVRKIEKVVFAALDEVAKEQLGSRISPKIAIQLEMARFRLKEFAKHQAKSVIGGWKIVSAERFFTKELDVMGRKFEIRGTIDRVEVNSNGQVRVLDYKTGSLTANRAHFNRDSWIDLQLPLYRELLSEIPELQEHNLDDNNVSLGYFKIGDQEATSGIDLLTPKGAIQDILQDTIDGTINSILDNMYSDVPIDPAPKFSDEFSWVCQDNNVVTETGGNSDD
ncbi:MAG: PD-(D/E)XK nuclease family protein [Planctomycetes bacterium]|nr:PD-(D/E)XK nuclease family protein [Planctomycetota bacterium]